MVIVTCAIAHEWLLAHMYSAHAAQLSSAQLCSAHVLTCTCVRQSDPLQCPRSAAGEGAQQRH